MIDIDGHIKIIDFSLSTTENWQDNFSFCQSTDIKPKEPENFKDYSALGSLLYHILTSTKPKINPIDQFLKSFPVYLSNNVKNLIFSLISATNNVEMNFLYIKNHPWCEGVDWESIRKKKGVPPFRPNLKKSNFDPEIVNIDNCIQDSLGDIVKNFNFCGTGVEKSFVNMGEMSFESNITSERNSTDADDTLNSLNLGRSLDGIGGNAISYENLPSFVIQPDENYRKSTVKSVSPHERSQKKGIKGYLKSFTKMEFLFGEDQRESLKEFDREFPRLNKDLTKMQQIVRKKIGENSVCTNKK